MRYRRSNRGDRVSQLGRAHHRHGHIGAFVGGSTRLGREAGLSNITFHHADILALPFDPASFDHILVFFVLGHMPDPAATLAALRPLLRPGGTITVIKGDRGSTVFHPDDHAARAVIACQVELQRRAGGDAMIGRQLYPLLLAAPASLRCGSCRAWSTWTRVSPNWLTASSNARSRR